MFGVHRLKEPAKPGFRSREGRINRGNRASQMRRNLFARKPRPFPDADAALINRQSV